MILLELEMLLLLVSLLDWLLVRVSFSALIKDSGWQS
jgi:hypothetical protein